MNTADIILAQRVYRKLGNTVAEVLKQTPTVARFAVAADQVGVEQSATYANIAAKNFKLVGDEVSHALDMMLLAETISPASARAIGESFQYSGKSAAAAGQDIAEYIALLTGLAESGREVESSSQGLGNLIGRISKAMAGVGRGRKIVTDAFTAIGIDLDEVRGELARGEKGWISLFKLIRERTEDLPKDVLLAFASALAGDSYASALLAMVENIDKVEERHGQFMKSAGESQRQAAIRMRGLSGAWENAKALWDTLQNALSDVSIGGATQKLFNFFSGIVGWLVEIDKETGKFVRGGWLKLIGHSISLAASLLLVGAALKGLALALGLVQWMIRLAIWLSGWRLMWLRAVTIANASMAFIMRKKRLLDAVLAFGGWKGLMITAFQAVKVKALATFAVMKTAALFTFGAISTAARFMWLAISGPIGWVIAGVLALIAVWYFFGDAIKGALSAAWQWLSGISWFEIGRNLIIGLAGGLVAAAPYLWDKLKGILGKVRDLLPFSDAREGPLSELTAAGEALVATLNAGIQHGGPSLRQSLRDLLALPLQAGPVPTPAFAGGFPPPGGEGGRSIEIVIEKIEVVAGSESNAKEIARGISAELKDQLRAVVEQADSKILV